MPDFRRPENKLFASPYACLDKKYQKRTKQLRTDRFRTDFQRDIHRIIYSQAFRRLRHKTQVFFFPRNDHVCTRMEHVLHVASASRTVARCLGLNEDLAEAIALAHDIGHAPFGHDGEKILDKIAKREKILPCFQHEIYGLRVVDYIAKLDREAPGLNLTWAVRDGIISHCGEDRRSYTIKPNESMKDLDSISSREKAGLPCTMEGCVVRMVDKIIYSGRDIEDAIATKVIKKADVSNGLVKALGKNNGAMIGTFLEDLVTNSFGKSCLTLSPKTGRLLKQLLKFNYKYIYNSKRAKRYYDHADRTLRSLFDILLKTLKSTNRFVDTSPKKTDIFSETDVYRVFKQFVTEDMKKIYTSATPDGLIVFDFIAGMTDNFAVQSFQELFVPQSTV